MSKKKDSSNMRERIHIRPTKPIININFSNIKRNLVLRNSNKVSMVLK